MKSFYFITKRTETRLSVHVFVCAFKVQVLLESWKGPMGGVECEKEVNHRLY